MDGVPMHPAIEAFWVSSNMKWTLPNAGGWYDQDPEMMMVWRMIWAEIAEKQKQDEARREANKNNARSPARNPGARPPRRGR